MDEIPHASYYAQQYPEKESDYVAVVLRMVNRALKEAVDIQKRTASLWVTQFSQKTMDAVQQCLFDKGYYCGFAPSGIFLITIPHKDYFQKKRKKNSVRLFFYLKVKLSKNSSPIFSFSSTIMSYSRGVSGQSMSSSLERSSRCSASRFFQQFVGCCDASILKGVQSGHRQRLR